MAIAASDRSPPLSYPSFSLLIDRARFSASDIIESPLKFQSARRGSFHSPRRICNENRNLCVSLFPLPSFTRHAGARDLRAINSYEFMSYIVHRHLLYLISSFPFPSKVLLSKARIALHICYLRNCYSKYLHDIVRTHADMYILVIKQINEIRT